MPATKNINVDKVNFNGLGADSTVQTIGVDASGNAVPQKAVIFTIDLMDEQESGDIYAPFDFKINSVENVKNTPSTTIEVEDSTYTLGDNITKGDKINIEVDTAFVINLTSKTISEKPNKIKIK